MVIAFDADLELAAKRFAMGAYYNSDQVCVSVQRIYCQKEIYRAFLEKFITASSAKMIGDPLDEQGDVGLMVNSDG